MDKVYRIGIDARLWNETGVGRYIRNLVSQLMEIDTTNQYILFLRKEEFTSLLLPSKNFEKRLADFRWHSFEEQYQFPAIINAENLDLVHFPYFSYPFFYRRKFVLTIHDLILHHFPTGRASTMPRVFYYSKLLAYKFLLRQGVRRAERVIVPSIATKNEVLDHFSIPEDKIVMTYEGVDNEIQKSAYQTKKQGKILETPYFLYVGNAYPHKNLERLVRAFRVFRNQIKGTVQLVLVGRNDYFYDRLIGIIKGLDLESSISLRHDIDDRALASLYSHALAVIAPSLMEGFGLSPLEAMARNCLVMAADIPVFHEICDDAAVYFDPYQIESIVQVMRNVYDDPKDFLHYKELGKQRVTLFSWREMAEETLKTYESCISL